MLQKASQAMMTIMKQILWHRFGHSHLKTRNGALLPYCQRERDTDYDSDGFEGFQLTLKFFLEAGQASIENDEVNHQAIRPLTYESTSAVMGACLQYASLGNLLQGMSSFIRLVEESQEPAIHVLELIQHSEEFAVRCLIANAVNGLFLMLNIFRTAAGNEGCCTKSSFLTGVCTTRRGLARY